MNSVCQESQLISLSLSLSLSLSFLVTSLPAAGSANQSEMGGASGLSWTELVEKKEMLS